MFTDGPDDHLDADPTIPKQQWAVYSVFTKNSVMAEDTVDFSTYAIKIRGVYETLEEAQERANYLSTIDEYFSIMVGQVGRWLPWDDSAENAESAVSSTPQLNDMMKLMKENKKKAEQYNLERIATAKRHAQEALEQQKEYQQLVDDGKITDEPEMSVVTEEEMLRQKEIVENIAAERKRIEEELKNMKK